MDGYGNLGRRLHDKRWRVAGMVPSQPDLFIFTLVDGRRITVLKHWLDDGVDGQFLRAVHRRACRYFRVVLGPAYNDLHKDHFHLDRGILATCR